MAIKLTESQLQLISVHARQTYPNECCGFLLGRQENGSKEVLTVLSAENAREDKARHNRYLITPDLYISADREARARGLDIIGFYHSHPNAPARPSQFDTDQAWPWYSYIIAEIRDSAVGEITSWVLRDDRTQFDEEDIETQKITAERT